jgi:hypothetical protein
MYSIVNLKPAAPPPAAAAAAAACVGVRNGTGVLLKEQPARVVPEAMSADALPPISHGAVVVRMEAPAGSAAAVATAVAAVTPQGLPDAPSSQLADVGDQLMVYEPGPWNAALPPHVNAAAGRYMPHAAEKLAGQLDSTNFWTHDEVTAMTL